MRANLVGGDWRLPLFEVLAWIQEFYVFSFRLVHSGVGSYLFIVSFLKYDYSLP